MLTSHKALFDHVASKPDMTMDDMLWWLYDQYKLVVGSRTLRRAFERRNTSHKRFRSNVRKDVRPLTGDESALSASEDDMGDNMGDNTLLSNTGVVNGVYQSPYAPIVPTVPNPTTDISPELAQALSGLTQGGHDNIHPDLMSEGLQLSEDEETLQLQLQQIALQKREVELKLKMRRLQRDKRTSSVSRLSTDPDTSFLTDLDAVAGDSEDQTLASTSSKSKPRDSRSKNKIEEAKKRTVERQERMLKELERRSRRRENLTAEWVQVGGCEAHKTGKRLTVAQSKDIWPQRAQDTLTDLMHRYGIYAYNQTSIDSFELIFHELYQLVDHSDWYPPMHDDLLRERTRRKMAQIRSKMVKSGEIISRGEGYGGWAKPADDGTTSDLAAQGLQSLPDMHLDMDMAEDSERNVDNAAAMMGGPSTYPQPTPQDEHDMLAAQQDLSEAHARALMGHVDMQKEFTQQDLARQHELLAQQGMAQHEQMAQHRQQTLEEGLSQAMGHQEMVM